MHTAVIVLACVVPAAHALDFSWTTNADHTITISGYTGPGGSVVIPDMITGLPVSRIGDYAFYEHNDVTSITIPNTVANIGKRAFSYCTGLTNVTIPNGVISMDFGAFQNSFNLTNVAIGNNVKSIGDFAFYGCGLTSVAIPNSVTNIGDAAFSCCYSLGAITVDAFNSSFSSLNGVLFNKSQTGLIQCPNDKTGSYAIPSSVTSIGNYAFHCCVSLTTITIPNSVTSIGDWTFLSCHSLTSVTIPNGVTNIGYAAFNGCYSLNAITVDALNFWFSSSNGVLFNGNGTMLIQCPIRKSGNYTVPNNVTNIGDRAFLFCGGLTNVTIPSSVIGIGNLAFQSCTGLTSVTIPEGVASIGDQAFFGCTRLHSIEIPNSVVSIGIYAFSYCTNLAGVYFQGNAPSIRSSVFLNANNATVYYLPGTIGWGPTFGGRPTALWLLPNPMILNKSAGFGVQTNGFGFAISWATNISVVVEASTSLVNPTWAPVATNTLTGGSSYFTDSRWTNYARRFYRVRSP